MVNDGAGPGEGDSDRLEQVKGAFYEAAGRHQMDVEVEVRSVTPEDLPTELTRAWDEDRFDAVAVGGGDGTISCGAGAAADVGRVLGVLPLGTFNHFARDVGLPVDLVDAAEVVLTGTVRSIDVGEVNGRVFVNNSVLGVYPLMVAMRDELRAQRGWGKIRAVPLASVRTLRAFPLHRFDVRGSGGFERPRIRTPFMFVGNGRYQADGGRPQREALDDGLLGLTLIRAVSRWGMVVSVVRALFRGTKGTRGLDEADLAEVTISSRASRLRVAVDGEITWMRPPLRFRVRPGELRVLLPRDPS